VVTQWFPIGSIRSPAANNGIWGLRPSSFRIPTDGWSCWAANVDEIPGVIGPLGKDLDGIEVFMKVVIGARPWLVEPALLPLQWTPYQVDSTAERPLTIAIMFHDDVVLPHPPITRAIEAMASKLGGLAHVCVSRWKPYHHQKAWAIISSLYYPDGGDEDAPLLEQAGEPMLALTRWIRGGPWVHKLTVGELQHWKREREGYRSEYARIWNEAAVDAILCPAGPGLAPAHETARYWGYTSQWNLLDYPAIVFPVSIANAQVDRKQRASDPMTSDDRYNWHLCKPTTSSCV
jgi:amidase